MQKFLKHNSLEKKEREWNWQRKLLSYTRTGVAAWAIGNAEGALENSISYITEGPQFGQMLSEFQAIRFKVAELATKIELVRSLVYRIASMVDNGIMEDNFPLPLWQNGMLQMWAWKPQPKQYK